MKNEREMLTYTDEDWADKANFINRLVTLSCRILGHRPRLNALTRYCGRCFKPLGTALQGKDANC